jgi:hypothetical protein
MGGKTISGTVTADKQTFDYAEVKHSDVGGGPRGIKISAAGVADSEFTFYPIQPNPHDNDKYNKGGDTAQKAFYKAVADAIVGGYAFDENEAATRKPLGEGERPEKVGSTKISGEAWMKLDVKQQKQLRGAANKEIETANTAALAAAKVKQIKAHLKAAGRLKVDWKGVKYTLPMPTT